MAWDRRGEVAALEQAVGQWRAAQGRPPLPASALPELPYGPMVGRDHEWRLRGHDLDLVTGLLTERPASRVLDIGAWNGWLSHRLSMAGHDVTATDVFAGPLALGAPWPDPPRWRRVQLEAHELDRLEQTFDVVIVDRCLQFFPEPAEAMPMIRRLIAANGNRHRDRPHRIDRSADAVAGRVDAEARRFRRRWCAFFLHAAKGYLDRTDLARLEAVGLATHQYGALRLANLRARSFDRSRPEHRYGIALR